MAETATDAADPDRQRPGRGVGTVGGRDGVLMAGDTGRALASAREAVARSERITETYFSSLSRLHLAAALNAAGDAAGARAELAAVQAGPGQRLLDLRGGLGWELLIRTQLALGDARGRRRLGGDRRGPCEATGLSQRTANAMCARAAVLLAARRLGRAPSACRRGDAARASAPAIRCSARARRALIGIALGRDGETKTAIAELEAAERTLFAARSAARRRRSRAGAAPTRPAATPAAAGGVRAAPAGRRAQRPRARGSDAGRRRASATATSPPRCSSARRRSRAISPASTTSSAIRSRTALAAIIAGERGGSPTAWRGRDPQAAVAGLAGQPAGDVLAAAVKAAW